MEEKKGTKGERERGDKEQKKKMRTKGGRERGLEEDKG